MKWYSLWAACVLGGALWATGNDNPTVEMEYFGPLPEFTPGAGKKTSWYVPMAVDMGGERPDLVLAAHSRLWFYINESKRGKVLFSEPIVLKTQENEEVKVLTAAVEQGNQLIIAGADLRLRRATVVGEDVPVLQLGGPVLSTTGEPMRWSAIRMVVTDEDGDGTPDLRTERCTYKGRVVDGELRFEVPEQPVDAERKNWGMSMRSGDFALKGTVSIVYTAMADFDGDGLPDIVCGGFNISHPFTMRGVIKKDN